MITIENLSKSYSRIRALTELSYEFRKGKVTTIVGPNGSGKTTLMKCILGFLRQGGGNIYFDGENIAGQSLYRDRTGYMAQKPAFPENLYPIEIIDLIKSLRTGKDTYDESLISEFEFYPELEKPFHSLSGGNKQKLNAIISFLFSPELVILDEPTAGLDPLTSKILKNKIKRERDNGKTILLTSHIIDEIEELTDDLIMLYEGKLKFSQKKEERSPDSQKPVSETIAELFRKAGDEHTL